VTAEAAPAPADPDANAVRKLEAIAYAEGYRDGNVVRIVYRQPTTGLGGAGIIQATLYGASTTNIVRSLCRHLGLAPADIAFDLAGEPKRWDVAWVLRVGVEGREARLARVAGESVAMLKIALTRQQSSGWRPAALRTPTENSDQERACA
jgi:hypothetical protein